MVNRDEQIVITPLCSFDCPHDKLGLLQSPISLTDSVSLCAKGCSVSGSIRPLKSFIRELRHYASALCSIGEFR